MFYFLEKGTHIPLYITIKTVYTNGIPYVYAPNPDVYGALEYPNVKMKMLEGKTEEEIKEEERKGYATELDLVEKDELISFIKSKVDNGKTNIEWDHILYCLGDDEVNIKKVINDNGTYRVIIEKFKDGYDKNQEGITESIPLDDLLESHEGIQILSFIYRDMKGM